MREKQKIFVFFNSILICITYHLQKTPQGTVHMAEKSSIAPVVLSFGIAALALLCCKKQARANNPYSDNSPEAWKITPQAFVPIGAGLFIAGVAAGSAMTVWALHKSIKDSISPWCGKELATEATAMGKQHIINCLFRSAFHFIGTNKLISP